jgi:hypothetical protein
MFGEIWRHLDIHTSLSISIHRNKTAIVNFRNLNIPGKSSIGAHKIYSLKEFVLCGDQIWTISNKSTVSNFLFYVYLVNQCALTYFCLNFYPQKPNS